MDQLSSCYFCGASLGASLDQYPVVPKDLDPDPDERVTVVLCQGCREKLGTVVERIIDAVETDAAAPEDNAAKGGFEFGEGATDDVGTDGAENVDAENEGVEVATDGVSDGETGQSPPAGTEASDPLDQDGAPADEAADTSADETSDENGDDASLTALEYSKVMRLLQNREFPVDRAEFRAIATNAYQISDGEFDAIVDAAIDRGLIAEENGQFVSAA